MRPFAEGDSSSQQGIDENEAAFASLITENGAPKIEPSINKFVKKLADIYEISLPPTLPRKVAISLAERGLMG